MYLQSLLVTSFNIFYIINIQSVYKIQCGLRDEFLTIGHERTEYEAYIWVASIISLSEVLGAIFLVLCWLLVQLTIYLFWIRKSFLCGKMFNFQFYFEYILVIEGK